MVPIPAGTFTMGSPESEAGRGADEGPQHKVALPAFYMATKEVTWSEYDEFAFSLDLQRKRKLGLTGPKDAGDAVSRPTPPYADESWGWGKEAQPVIGVTQYAASRYCEWLSARTGKKYRLPTEAEWEYAARAGTTTAYSFGNDPAAAGDYAWFKDNAGEQPHVGGAKKPNAWGLFDIARQRRGMDCRQVRRRLLQLSHPRPRRSTIPARSCIPTRSGAARGTTSRRSCGRRHGDRQPRRGAGAIRRTRRACGGTPTRHSSACGSSPRWTIPASNSRLSGHLTACARRKRSSGPRTGVRHGSAALKAGTPSRRDFIKTSTAAIVGGTIASSLSTIPGAYAAGSDEIRVGVIGCGGRGTGAVDNVLVVRRRRAPRRDGRPVQGSPASPASRTWPSTAPRSP